MQPVIRKMRIDEFQIWHSRIGKLVMHFIIGSENSIVPRITNRLIKRNFDSPALNKTL